MSGVTPQYIGRGCTENEAESFWEPGSYVLWRGLGALDEYLKEALGRGDVDFVVSI